MTVRQRRGMELSVPNPIRDGSRRELGLSQSGQTNQGVLASARPSLLAQKGALQSLKAVRASSSQGRPSCLQRAHPPPPSQLQAGGHREP